MSLSPETLRSWLDANRRHLSDLKARRAEVDEAIKEAEQRIELNLRELKVAEEQHAA